MAGSRARVGDGQRPDRESITRGEDGRRPDREETRGEDGRRPDQESIEIGEGVAGDGQGAVGDDAALALITSVESVAIEPPRVGTDALAIELARLRHKHTGVPVRYVDDVGVPMTTAATSLR